MGLTERRVSRGNSLQGPLLHSSGGGRKQNAKNPASIRFKLTGISVLTVAATFAVLGIWHVERAGITTAGLHLQAPAAPRTAFSRFRDGFTAAARTDRSSQQASATAAAASASATAAVQHSISSAPFPEELPPHKPDLAVHHHDDDIVKPPSQPVSLQQQQRQQSAAAATPSAPLPQQQQQQQDQTPYIWESYAARPSAAAAVLPKNRLLLSSHSRLMWYFPDTDESLILHDGEGVHYGAFPGGDSQSNPDRNAEPSSVWTAIRPHNWRPATNKEYLVELDMLTGVD